jgi:hypothetical protein
MPVERDTLLRIQAGAITGQDLDTFAAQVAPHARLVRDGHILGRGPAAARQMLRDEIRYGGEDGVELMARLEHMDGEPVVVAYPGGDGRRPPRAVFRFDVEEERITECRLVHDAAFVARLAGAASRAVRAETD